MISDLRLLTSVMDDLDDLNDYNDLNGVNGSNDLALT